MRVVVASLGLILGMAILLPAATNPAAVAQGASPAPSLSVEPSASATPTASPTPSAAPSTEARVDLMVAEDTEPLRNWTIAVTGGSPSVSTVLVPYPPDAASVVVTVFGPSAMVEMTAALPAGSPSIGGDCADEAGGEGFINPTVPPRRLVLEVLPGHHYVCIYTSDAKSDVGLEVSARGIDISRPWQVSVTGGRAVAFATGRRISAFTLRQDPDFADGLVGGFKVEVLAESTSVEITAPLSPGGALVSAVCERQEVPDLPLFSVLVPPRRLVLDVIPLRTYQCFVGTRAGTVPATDTHAFRKPGPSLGGWSTALAALAGISALSVLIFIRDRGRAEGSAR
jgi:hypothetical protein